MRGLLTGFMVFSWDPLPWPLRLPPRFAYELRAARQRARSAKRPAFHPPTMRQAMRVRR